MGELNTNLLQTVPEHSMEANTALNDNGITLSQNPLKSEDFKLDGSGNIITTTRDTFRIYIYIYIYIYKEVVHYQLNDYIQLSTKRLNT
jgi:hypothetical protein